MVVKPAAVFGSGTWAVTELGLKKTVYLGEEDIKKDVWTSGRARNMENKK